MLSEKTAIVCGAGGFIGGHLVKSLISRNYYVRGVDLKMHEFCENPANEFILADLRDPKNMSMIFGPKFGDWNEVYQLAADMGGAGFVFTGDNDADILHNNCCINLNVAKACADYGVRKIFFSSSACAYPEYNQQDPANPKCSEDSVYPCQPDSNYGWEKIYSERLYLAYMKNRNLEVRIARLHNIFGPEGTWEGGREKAPAALCRKVAMAENNGEIQIWGTGEQTRSFLYIDDCIEGINRLMSSSFCLPLNIGSEEMVTINQLARMIMNIAGKRLSIKHIKGPLGVMGRNSDNHLIRKALGWEPTYPLRKGLGKTYAWIRCQLKDRAK